MTERYNGWTNYETWCANLWMDGDSEHWREQAQELVNTFDDEATYELSQHMKNFYEEFMPETAGMYADLLNAAMSSINWHEIARHYTADVEVEEPDDVEE